MVPPAVGSGSMGKKPHQFPSLAPQFIQIMETVVNPFLVSVFVDRVGNEVNELVFPGHDFLLNNVLKTSRPPP
jgi:hypothetical protein